MFDIRRNIICSHWTMFRLVFLLVHFDPLSTAFDHREANFCEEFHKGCMATNLSIKQPGIHSSQAEHVESKTVIPLPASKTGTVKRQEHVCFVHPAHELVINCNRLCAIDIDFLSFLSVKPFAGIDWLFTCKVGNGKHSYYRTKL